MPRYEYQKYLAAASFSTASGAILGMSALIIRDIAGFRRDSDANHKDPQLHWARICMVPLTLAGIFIAARIAQTGILLTLAFDLMLCCLIPALFGGLFWKRSSTKAVAVSSIVGLVLRLGFFVLVPTVYGADNTLLYIPNDIFSSDMDGWCTFISFGCATVAYFAVAAFCPRTIEEDEREQKELLSLEQERTISSEALYHRALKVQREDTLDFYESAKRAGFPVDVELSQARHALDKSIAECVGAVE